MNSTWAHASAGGTNHAADKQPRYQSSVAYYRCEGKQRIEAAYLNIENGGSFATLHYKGRLIPMHIDISGSGALYIADDEQDSYRWHAKGERGILSFLAADHAAHEEIILRDCKIANPRHSR